MPTALDRTSSSVPAAPVIHLLPNAHLDPVWLWDWREGLNEGLRTVRAMLDLMDEFSELTFVRGEAAIYRHIQQTCSTTWLRLRKRIEEGRWDVVGGTLIQPDSNLSSTATLCRNFDLSLRYFKDELGVRPRIAWQADSFGHTPGWPNILRAFGMEGFAFTRPQENQIVEKSPAFWWACDHADKLLCYRPHWEWYGCERANLPEALDITFNRALGGQLQNVGILFGLGDHGGGPSRRHVHDVEAWRAAHPEVEVRFSTLTKFFADLHAEIAAKRSLSIPTVRGELGYCLRGCYSAMQRFKSVFRHAEAQVHRADVTASLLGQHPSPSPNLAEAWDAVIFNSFHDILPGSSIERAMEEQSEWTAMATHKARAEEFAALNRLAVRVNSTVTPPARADFPEQVPILIWNPLPRPFSGPVELEAALDYRPIWDYLGRPDEVPFSIRDEQGDVLASQEIATEHHAIRELAWRKRVITHLEIPAFGWRVLRMGLETERRPVAPTRAKSNVRSRSATSIENQCWAVKVSPAKRLSITRDGSAFFDGPLQLLVVEDPWGSWGGMKEEPDSWKLDRIRERWKITNSHVLESGPEQARLWTRWEGKKSWIEMTFDVYSGTPILDVRCRLLWNERSARLQLSLPSTGSAVCDMAGGQAVRTERGQVPVGRWFVRQDRNGRSVGVASDVLSDADFLPSETRLTLARATRFADDVPTSATEAPWRPAGDCGELKCRIAFFGDDCSPDDVGDFLTQPPRALPISSQPGDLPATGSLGSILPASARIITADRNADGTVTLLIQNRSASIEDIRFAPPHSRAKKLGRLGPQELRHFIINPNLLPLP